MVADNWAAACPRLVREAVIAQVGAKLAAAALHSLETAARCLA